jgi:hypothetical protein
MDTWNVRKRIELHYGWKRSLKKREYLVHIFADRRVILKRISKKQNEREYTAIISLRARTGGEPL